LALYAFWYTRGRDRPVALVADYRATPPSNLEPGVVGTLVDEKADMKDIIATLIDLARRGVISMEEEERGGFLGLGSSRDFVFRRQEEPADLREHEKRLLRRLFGGRQTRRLSDLKNQFYKFIPDLQKRLYQQVVDEGFFTGSPQRTRGIYTALGIGALVIFGAIELGLIVLFSDYTRWAFCPSIGLGITSVGLIILGQFMPRKTRKGSEAAAQWNAFKRYLANIEKYTDLREAQEIFDGYLPYAIAFGLERSWIRKFAQVDTPAPYWYHPYPPVMYAGRGRRPGGRIEPVSGRSIASPAEGGGVPSLQQMSDGMAGSLQSMSDGLIYIKYKSLDELGNEESVRIEDVYLDNSPPTSAVPGYDPLNVSYISNSLQTIAVTTADGGSGVGSTCFGIDDPNCSSTYTGPLVSGSMSEGEHTIYFRSIDNVGNEEAVRSITIFLDITPPVADAGEDEQIRKGDIVVFDGSESHDGSSGSGISEYKWTFTYRGSTVTLQGETPQFTFEDKDVYIVTLTVTDRAGNEDMDTMTITFAPQKDVSEFPLWVIAFLIIIIILSLLVFLFWRKRREDETEETDEE